MKMICRLSWWACVGLFVACDSGNNGGGGDVGMLDTVSDSQGGDSVGSDVSGDTSGDVVVTDPDPNFEWPHSLFNLELASWGLSFMGLVTDGPRVEFHHESERDGLCRLLEYEPSLCEPACEPTAACVMGTCLNYPVPVSAGTVELLGFSGGPITVAESAVGQYFYQTEAIFTTDAPGDIGLKVLGTALVPAFEVAVGKVEPPVPNGDWIQLMSQRADGEDVTLTWAKPDVGARIYLRMTTGIGTHGGISPVEIECEGPDTGKLRLPGAYLDALYAQGWSCGECGGNDVWRYRAVNAEGDLGIQFRTQARYTFFHHPNLN